MFRYSLRIFAAGALAAALFSGCAADRGLIKKECRFESGRIYFAAPTLLPGTTVEMKTPGYWISRHPYPDRLIMSPDEIVDFNSGICRLTGVIPDIPLFPERISRKAFSASLRRQLERFRRGRYYRSDGSAADNAFYSPIEENMVLFGPGAADIDVRFAYVVHNADQRLLPVKEGLNASPGDADFDELQNSSLGPGTPVAVLHTSRDGKWHYVSSTVSEGWVEEGRLAFCGREETRDADSVLDFAVVTAARADIYLDSGLKEYYDYARMGDRFILKSAAPAAVEIVLLLRARDGRLKRASGYISIDEVNRGYLPYTPRNAIRQAFRMLNTPYGWGGMYGEQDCSQFIREVFSVMGIKLPRNSSVQAQVGRPLACDPAKEKEKCFSRENGAAGGITTVCLNGHIMLFLGTEGGRPYAIHDGWAYRVRDAEGKDEVRLVNRVAVTGLDLGEGSSKGSFLNRIKSLRIIAGDLP
jgi:hypothetical protein